MAIPLGKRLLIYANKAIRIFAGLLRFYYAPKLNPKIIYRVKLGFALYPRSQVNYGFDKGRQIFFTNIFP